MGKETSPYMAGTSIISNPKINWDKKVELMNLNKKKRLMKTYQRLAPLQPNEK